MDAAIRECKEEVGISPLSLKQKGVIYFHYKNNPDWDNECHVFTSENEDDVTMDKIQESEEMLPKWFDVNEIPFEGMWEDSKIWFKPLIAREDVHYEFFFDGEKLQSYNKIERK